MSVLVHPKCACSPQKVAEIQIATGLRATIAGRTVQLLLPNGQQPTMSNQRKRTSTSTTFNGPCGGGSAA